jgi:hypothetical protein
MTRFAWTTAACVAFVSARRWPTVPRASQPSVFDPPPVYYPPQHVWPRTCPLDGEGAQQCKQPRERGWDRRGR